MKRHADEKIRGVEDDARRCENVNMVIAMMIAENIQVRNGKRGSHRTNADKQFTISEYLVSTQEQFRCQTVIDLRWYLRTATNYYKRALDDKRG